MVTPISTVMYGVLRYDHAINNRGLGRESFIPYALDVQLSMAVNPGYRKY